ncbi:MAG: glycerol-3-phosphate dehydrogenase (NAD(P)+) [Alphaproteobacteria bacterium]|jgi:glycerol-3-phosphate dehydrogenase (NAD(P)+)
MAARHTVAEGAHTAGAVLRLAATLGVEMPIADSVDQVVNKEAKLDDVVAALLARPFKREGILE